jgi:hypothetical protein
MNENKIDVVLSLDELSLSYRVELEPDEALKWSWYVMDYNEATAQVLRQLVEAVNARVPRMQYNDSNPNNGKPTHSFYVGREGSRVMYVSVRLYHLVSRAANPYTSDDIETLKKDLVALGYQHRADESWVEEEDRVSLTVRYWWD